MRLDIKTRGFNLSKFDAEKIIQVGLFNSSGRIMEQAQANAPIDTGKLKQSIGRQPAVISRGIKKVIVGPRGNPQAYAQRREFENKKNPGKKFYMKRAYEKAETVIQEEFKKALKIFIK